MSPLALLLTGAGVVLVVGGVWSLLRSAPSPPPESVVERELADPREVYDPVKEGETLPPGYRSLLGRDQITPIYDPVFTTADNVEWTVDSLIIGVAGEITAKAYPVPHLNSREMVIDEIEGLPILVSW